MKDFWSNLFFDMDECGLGRFAFTVKVGNDICDNLRRIEDAIKDHDGKKALQLIEGCKKQY